MPQNAPVLGSAFQIIRSTPGYAKIAVELAQLASDNRIRIDRELEDRAQAGLLGTIILGVEAIESHPLSLAQTLLHEYYHLKQNPFEKTISYWCGVWKRTPVMQRFERPAYRAALDFLQSVENSHPA